MDTEFIESLFPRNPNFNFGIFSSSGSGKSRVAIKFLTSFNTIYYNTKVNRVYILAPRYQKIYDEVKHAYGEKFTFIEGFDQSFLDKIDADYSEDSVSLVFIDDLAEVLSKSEAFLSLYTCYSHHRQLCLLVSAHNIYEFSRDTWRSWIRNLHMAAIGNSVTMRHSIGIFFSQIFGSKGATIGKALLREVESLQKQRYSNAFYFLYLNLSPTILSDNRIFYDPFANIPIIFRPSY